MGYDHKELLFLTSRDMLFLPRNMRKHSKFRFITKVLKSCIVFIYLILFKINHFGNCLTLICVQRIMDWTFSMNTLSQRKWNEGFDNFFRTQLHRHTQRNPFLLWRLHLQKLIKCASLDVELCAIHDITAGWSWNRVLLKKEKHINIFTKCIGFLNKPVSSSWPLSWTNTCAYSFEYNPPYTSFLAMYICWYSFSWNTWLTLFSSWSGWDSCTQGIVQWPLYKQPPLLWGDPHLNILQYWCMYIYCFSIAIS